MNQEPAGPPGGHIRQSATLAGFSFARPFRSPYNIDMRALALLFLASAAGAQTLPEILSRVSEEAEVFRRVAPQVLSEETLTQRALKPPPRFHPRLGATAAQPLA